MGFKKKVELSADTTFAIGGTNSKTGAANPTSVEGYYIGTKLIQGDYDRPSPLHYFQTAEGVVGVWGKSHSQKLLTADHVGQMVRLTFVGMKAPFKKGRRPSYQFALEYDEENTIDTSGITLESAATDSSEDSYSSNSDDLDTNDLDNDEQDAPAPVISRVAANPAANNGSNKAKIQELLNRTRK